MKNNQPQKDAQISIKGNSNNVVNGDKNIIVQNINPIIKKPNIVKPNETHITNEQQFAIQEKIKEIVEKEIIGGKSSNLAYASAWGAFKKKFKITSYKELEKERFEEAIKYLNIKNAIKRPKIRRRDNGKWRAEIYSAIWAKARELNLSKEEVYQIVLDKYNKKISSLTELGEQVLTKLKSHLFSKKVR